MHYRKLYLPLFSILQFCKLHYSHIVTCWVGVGCHNLQAHLTLRASAPQFLTQLRSPHPGPSSQSEASMSWCWPIRGQYLERWWHQGGHAQPRDLTFTVWQFSANQRRVFVISANERPANAAVGVSYRHTRHPELYNIQWHPPSLSPLQALKQKTWR